MLNSFNMYLILSLFNDIIMMTIHYIQLDIIINIGNDYIIYA
jgi:hypothetical protein